MRSQGLSGTNWTSHNAYHSDANGNVTALVNSSGVLQASYRYNPYGALISSSGALASANRMRFSSKPAIQSATGGWGFYYYGYRFYDPLNQRWLNRDPLEERGGKNLFGFVGNRPTLAVDDYGNSPTLVIGAIGAGLGAVIGGGIAWWNGGDAMDILEGAGRGALIGGIAGLTGGAAAGLIGGSGTGAGIAAGLLGGAVGDLAGQGVELALGWRCEYSWRQTALSASFCGAVGGAGRHLGRAGAAAKATPPLRQQYINEVLELKDIGNTIRTAGVSAEDTARILHQMRRDLGVQYKNLTPADKLAEITARNIQKYGDPLGPSVDWLRAQGKSWEQIIESASRPGGMDLGL